MSYVIFNKNHAGSLIGKKSGDLVITGVSVIIGSFELKPPEWHIMIIELKRPAKRHSILAITVDDITRKDLLKKK